MVLLFSVLPTDAKKIIIEFYDAYASTSFDSVDNISENESILDEDKV